MRAVRQILAALLVALAAACAIPGADTAAIPNGALAAAPTCATGDRTVLFYWEWWPELSPVIEGGSFASIAIDPGGAIVIEPASGRKVSLTPSGRYTLFYDNQAGMYVAVCTVAVASTQGAPRPSIPPTTLPASEVAQGYLFS